MKTLYDIQREVTKKPISNSKYSIGQKVYAFGLYTDKEDPPYVEGIVCGISWGATYGVVYILGIEDPNYLGESFKTVSVREQHVYDTPSAALYWKDVDKFRKRLEEIHSREEVLLKTLLDTKTELCQLHNEKTALEKKAATYEHFCS